MAKKQKPFIVFSPSSYRSRQVMGRYKTKAEAEKAIKEFQPHMPKDHKPLEIRVNEEIDEGIIGDFIHKLAVSAKMKKFIRWYLDWRKKNPGQGKQGVMKAAKILGLTPQDANAMIAKLNDMVKSGQMPKHLAIAEETTLVSFKTYISERQDPDIKDREGTQPARYHTGLSKSTKVARDRQFKKQTKMADDDPAAYKPAPGDETAKTKPSKYTKFVNKMMKEASFEDKSKASGISVDTLKKVYNRGVAAWKTGHRPGTTASQWGHARVNAFITKKKKGNLDHDKDLA